MGSVTKLPDLEERLERTTTDLLLQLRMTKLVNPTAMAELIDIADALNPALASANAVPRRLVGKLWFVFTAMLAEAGHTRSPDAILAAAWDYQEHLRRVFGPVD